MTHIQDPRDEKHTLCGEQIEGFFQKNLPKVDYVPYDEDSEMLADCEDCLILYPIGNMSQEEKRAYFTKKENIQIEDKMQILKETGEMGEHDIEEGGEFYENAQMLKTAAKHIQKLTKGMLQFVKVRPFDKYQGPYAQCSILNSWGRLWFGHGGGEDPGYYILENPNENIEGDVYEIAKLVRKLVKEKLGINEDILKQEDKMELTEKKGVKYEDILKYGTKEEVKFLKEDIDKQGKYENHREYDNPGICPKCKSEDIDYGDSEPVDTSYVYEAHCNKCGIDFKEWYDMVFSYSEAEENL